MAAPPGTAGPAVEAAGRVRLEHESRLSASVLWGLARSFYEREGAAAWSSGCVPHYVTNNPRIADAYARVTLAFLRDADERGELDRSRPLHLVELGSGSGRFAHAFLRAFLPLLESSALRELPFTYVMTDLAERNVEAWRAHPRLRPLVARGVLELARFDVDAPDELVLLESGARLERGGGNPLVLVANYVLDSLPPDCFTLEAGELRETLLTSTVAAEHASDPAASLDSLGAIWTARPYEGAYYGEPDLDAVLDSHRTRLGDTTFLFPVTALRCLRFFRELAQGRMLVLSADNGYAHAQDLLWRTGPGFARHGAVSCMVNYHAIGEYVRGLGGAVLHPRHQPAHLTVAAYVLGDGATGFAETAREYGALVAEGGPDDWFSLKQLLDPHFASLSLDQALACLRLSGWDGKVFLDLFATFVCRVEESPEALWPDVYRAVHEVWDAHYEIGDGVDVAFCIGILLSGIRYHVEALGFFERSLELCGQDPTTTFAMATTHYALRDLDAALEWIERTLELDPAFAPAKDLRLTIEAHLELAAAVER